MTNTTTMGELLMRVYDGKSITELQNLSSPFMAMLDDAVDFTIGGESFRTPVLASGDESYRYMNENDELPTPQNEEVRQTISNPTVFAGAVRITGLGKAISDGNPRAFANGLQLSIDKKIQRMGLYKEGALFRDGTGRLSAVQTAPAADTTTTPFPIYNPGAMWLRRNQIINFKNGAVDRAGATNVKLTEVNWQGNGSFATIRTDVNLNAVVSADDDLYLAGTHPAGSVGTPEIAGLDAAIATSGTYAGISRATIPEWKSNVIDAASGDVDEDLLFRSENILKVVGGLTPMEVGSTRIVWHENQQRKYFEVVVPQKQFVGLDLDAGYKKLSWNGREFVVAYTCPEDKIYMGNLDAFQRLCAPGGELQMDKTFGTPIKWAQNYDAGICYMREYCQYLVRKPNNFIRLDNLANVATR